MAEEPALATTTMEHWCDHQKGASPLGYVAMLRYDTSRRVWRDVSRTSALARALLDAGGWLTAETPLAAARIRALVIDVSTTSSPPARPSMRSIQSGGGHPLRTAASGRPASVHRLLAHGADPNLRAPEHGRTPLDWCRRSYAAARPSPGHEQVERLLEPLTSRAT